MMAKTSKDKVAPDIQEYIDKVTEGCELLEKEYSSKPTVEEKVDFVFKAIKELILAGALKGVSKAMVLDEKLASLRNRS
jgi:hypothetical protein